MSLFRRKAEPKPKPAPKVRQRRLRASDDYLQDALECYEGAFVGDAAFGIFAMTMYRAARELEMEADQKS